MKKGIISLAILFFLLTRFYILKNPPYKNNIGYSDVKHDYERYANIWWYGLPPYLKHLYEYPPATIPLVVFPLFLDQKGVGKYYQNYRFQIFVFDIIFFLVLLYFLNKTKIKNSSKFFAGLFYIFSGLIAKDFLYDGIDLIFSGTLALSLIFFRLFNQEKFLNKIFFYSLFWLSVAIKLISAPLLIPYFFLSGKILKKEILAFIGGFLVVWGIPIFIFGSSLSVTFVYNFSRPFKYCSFPYFIAETINAFTKTEIKIDNPPDFSLEGPYSKAILGIFNKVLPIAIILIIIYSLYNLFKRKNLNPYFFAVKITLIYIFIFFLVSKIYSQPFPIWLVPLVSILPFPSVKRQLVFILLTALLLIIDTTNILNLGLFGLKTFIYPLTYGFLRSLLKFGVMTALLFLSFKIPTEEKYYR